MNNKDKDLDKDENLSDISNISFTEEDEKNDKTKKIIFGGVIFAVLVIISIVIFTSLSSNTVDNNQDSADIDFLEDDEPFFMDSPADSVGENNGVDDLQEDDMFSTETLLNNSGENSQRSEDNIYDSEIRSSSLSPVTSDTVSNLSSDKTSLMSKENENPIIHSIKPEKAVRNVNHYSAPIQTAGIDRELFIQTGTFFKFRPNKKYLKSITDLGFEYSIDIYNQNNQEITRVLVGPFKSKSDANEALLSIRDKIVKDAYVIKTRLH